LFSKYAGVEIKLDGENYIVMRQLDILGVFDDREEN
jgi:co-chaperonin GroES (HSP10)